MAHQEDARRLGGALAALSIAAAGLAMSVVDPAAASSEVLAIEPSTIVFDDVDLRDAVAPVNGRYLDSRPDGATVDGEHVARGRVPAGATYRLDLLGRPGIADDAGRAVVNVVAVDPAADGHLIVWGCVDDRPATSLGNYRSGETVATQTVVEIEDGVCISTHASTHLVVDVVGTMTGTSSLHLRRRLIDTRLGVGGIARLQQDVPVELGLIDVPGESGVFMVTAVDAEGAGHLQVGPCDAGRVDVATSLLNVEPGQTQSNGVVLDRPACLVASTDVDVIVDGVISLTSTPDVIAGGGTLPTTAWHPSSRSARWFDSRERGAQVDAGSAVIVDDDIGLLARADLPLINLTVVDPSGPGHLVAYGCDSADDPVPTGVSSMNYAAGDVRAHLTLVDRSIGEHVCVWSNADTELVVDSYGRVLPDVPVAVRWQHPCGEVDSVDDGRAVLVRPANDVDHGIALEVWGTDPGFAVDASGPTGWAITIAPPPAFMSGFTLTWDAPDDTPLGTFPISVVATSASGTTATLTVDVTVVDPAAFVPAEC